MYHQQLEQPEKSMVFWSPSYLMLLLLATWGIFLLSKSYLFNKFSLSIRKSAGSNEVVDADVIHKGVLSGLSDFMAYVVDSVAAIELLQ